MPTVDYVQFFQFGQKRKRTGIDQYQRGAEDDASSKVHYSNILYVMYLEYFKHCTLPSSSYPPVKPPNSANTNGHFSLLNIS